MLDSCKRPLAATFVAVLYLALAVSVSAQSSNSTSVSGTVVDPTGAVVAHATVEMRNPVSGFLQSTVTDGVGKFTFSNVPFNPYHLTVAGEGLRRTCRTLMCGRRFR